MQVRSLESGNRLLWNKYIVMVAVPINLLEVNPTDLIFTEQYSVWTLACIKELSLK